MAVYSQILHRAFERPPGSRSQFLAHIVAAKKNGSIVPACERKPPITQNYLT